MVHMPSIIVTEHPLRVVFHILCNKKSVN